jgi:hypothetical protein
MHECCIVHIAKNALWDLLERNIIIYGHYPFWPLRLIAAAIAMPGLEPAIGIADILTWKATDAVGWPGAG